MRRLDFSDHRRSLDDNRYVYAVVSRRVGGLSIGINLNPDKACNFDCPYCQVDRTIPGGDRAIDLDVLDTELDRLLSWVADGSLWEHAPFDTADPQYRRVGDISFAGDGEPTAAVEFAAAMARVVTVRSRHGLEDVCVSLLTNATLFQRDAVRLGLDALHGAGGEIWGKLDAGSEPWFRRVDGTTVPFQRVLDNLHWAAQTYRLTIQSMFHTFDGVGPSDEEVHAWVGRLSDVLEAGIEVSGTIEITLYVSTDVKDTDFTVKLIDVYPDGKAYNLDETIQRARYREGYDKEVFMEEGNVYKIRVSPMSTSNYFGPGHRVRIEVSSSNFPRFARNLNTGGNNYDEAQGITAYNNVHHSEEFPSQIRLPIVEQVPNQSEQNGE